MKTLADTTRQDDVRVQRAVDRQDAAGQASVGAVSRGGQEPTGSHPGGWRYAVNEGIRSLGLWGMPLILLLAVLPIARTPIHHHVVADLGLGLITASLLGTSWCLWTRHHRTTTAQLLAWVMVVGIGCMTPFRDEIVPSDLWAAGMFMVPVTALVAIGEPRARWPRALAGPMLGLVLAEALGWFFWSATRLRIADEVFVLEPLATLAFFALALAGIAERHDATAEHAARLRASSLEQRAQTEARRESDRLLHDYVLHALHAVGTDRALVTSRQAVDECDTTLAQLAMTWRPDHDLALEELLEEDPAVRRVAGRVEGNVGIVPPVVAAGIAAATHEAVVNVERHAQASHCEVLLESLEDRGCRVLVRDDGRGFDAARRPRGRLGLTQSVIGRLDDIGGEATVHSAPGRGTTVEMVWPRQGAGPRAISTHTNRESRTLIMLAALPAIVCCLILMPVLGPQLPRPVPLYAVTIVSIAVTLWGMGQLMRPVVPRYVPHVLGFVALAGWVVSLLLMPVHHPSVYDLWMAWISVCMVQVLVLALPRRAGFLYSAALLVALTVGVVWKFGPTAAWQRESGTVVAGLIVVVVGYRALFFSQDVASQADRAQDSVERTRAETALMHKMARVDQFWSTRINGEALPLVRAVAVGRLDPADEQVRSEARRLEQLVRDELVLGPGEHLLGERLTRLRAQGWLVQSSLSRDDAALLTTAARLVDVLGEPSKPGQLVTLAGVGHTVTAVVLDSTPGQQEDWHSRVPDIGGNMDSDPEFVRLTVVSR